MNISQSLAKTTPPSMALPVLALLALVLLQGNALADEVPAASVEPAVGDGNDRTAPVDLPIEGTGGRVFLSAAVGQVSIGLSADPAGGKVYAERSAIAGSATIVSFSSSPPRPNVSGAFAGHLSTPLPQGILTSQFGALRAQGGGGTRAHAGVDLAAPQGSPVLATLDGRVSVANWAGSYGLLVILEHPSGRQTRYAHLSSIAVAPGQTVRQGQVLGRVGSTGRSTGPHLHYEMRQDGRPIDPIATSR